VAALEPRIQTIADALIDEVEPSGRIEFVEQFSFALPIMVIAEILGVEEERRADFRRWSTALAGGAGGSGDLETYQEGVRGLNTYFRRVIAERRQEPQSDLISALVAAADEGDALTEGELLGFCKLLL